jgi:carboxymethylenebutenolidase
MTERVSFTSRAGTELDGALAVPTRTAPAPGVVVIHEWWGLSPHIEEVCERFAAEGFVALAPDVFHGAVTTDAAEAAKLMGAVDWRCAIDDIAGAVEHLRAHPQCSGKIAVTGFCMGGAMAFATACSVTGLAAVVPYYGVPAQADWSKVDAPIQAHFAKVDDWAKPALAEDIQAEVERHGGAMELHVYDAQHAFFNDRRPEVHDAEAARVAWARTIAFLRKHT